MQFLKYVQRNSLITYYLFLLEHLFFVQTYLNWSVRKTQEIKQKAITRTKIDEIAKKLKPYGIIIP